MGQPSDFRDLVETVVEGKGADRMDVHQIQDFAEEMLDRPMPANSEERVNEVVGAWQASQLMVQLGGVKNLEVGRFVVFEN